MGQLATAIHNAATIIPAAPAATAADLLDGPELLRIFAAVEAAVAALELRAAGSRIRDGLGAPDQPLGNDFDLYVDKANGDLWAKDGGAWARLLNLRGPAGLNGRDGATGATGDPGLRGATGAAGRNGTNGTNGVDGQAGAAANRLRLYAAAPVASDGNVDDVAIVIASGDLLEKTLSGWAVRGNVKGPKGDVGATGPTGAAGAAGGAGNTAPAAGGTVKSVNGATPDANGNVSVAVGGAAYTDAQAVSAVRSSQATSTTVIAPVANGPLEIKEGSIQIRHLDPAILSNATLTTSQKNTISNAANWSGKVFSGALVGTLRGQFFADANYFYMLAEDNFPVRTILS